MLELKNITKKFGSRTILNKLNLTIPDQQILAIVGPSGAGKTTLLRCLSGLERIDAGEFLWDGQKFDPLLLIAKVILSESFFKAMSFFLI